MPKELDHAIADHSEALRLDAGYAQALFRRGMVSGDKARGDADVAAATKLDSGLVE